MQREKCRGAVAIGVLVCALAGCLAPRALPQPPERITLGAFSFLPPDEPGWVVTSSDARSFDAGRRGPKPDESYTVLAKLLRSEAVYESDEAFLAMYRKRMSSEPASKSTDVQLWKKLGARCLRTSDVTITPRPASRSGTGPMVLSCVSFHCVHPRDSHRIIWLGMSQLCNEGEEDPALGEKAEVLGASLEFLEP